MTIADVLAGIAALFLIGFGLSALWTILNLTVSETVREAGEALKFKPFRMCAVGLAAFVGFVVVGTILAKGLPGPLKVFGLMTLLVGLSLAMIGGAGMVRHLAYLLRQKSNSESFVKNLFFGSVLLETAMMLPFVGWFVVFPVAFLMMFGAGFVAVLKRMRSKASPVYSIPIQSVPPAPPTRAAV